MSAAGLLLWPLAVGATTKKPTKTAAKTAAKSAAKSAVKSNVKSAGAKKINAAAHSVHGGTATGRDSRTRLTAAESRAESARKAAESAQALRLNSAFIATSQLRPMAQELANTRSAASYSGVMSYAASHPGVAAATAELALGHAYTLDRRYADAANAYRAAGGSGDGLSDYADYLQAQALVEANRPTEAYPLLEGFADRHPGSIFAATSPVLLATAHLQANDGSGAVRVLEPLTGTEQASHVGFEYALARGYQLSGNSGKAAQIYQSIYALQPLTYEASQARIQMQAMGAGPSAAERKVHADQLFNTKHYGEAEAEYGAIKNDASLTQADRDALQIYSAVCELKLKHLSRGDVDKLPVTGDDSAALKLYLYAEISRNEKDRTGHDALIAQLVQKYPASRWTEEALYSGGNMYLLTHDAPQAIYHYGLLVQLFPNSVYAPSSHWREAWLNYRLRKYPEASRLMEEQVVKYPASVEASSALYWRARIYEDEEHDFGQAVNYYRSLAANYPNFYYGVLARARLSVLGPRASEAPAATLASVRVETVPDLVGVVPVNDPHYIKAKLLANAALNEYIGPEIAAGAGAEEWGALAQAEIYASYGEVTRSLQAMKHSGISFFSLPESAVPMTYWRLIFPQPYWEALRADSENNGLDPYLVASLIRQESEFNAGAVSPAHAYGLMQLLASVGKENAKKEGIKHFDTAELLNPTVNLDLGTRNLRQVLDRFGGQPEYALAAYNAGDVPVRQWLAAGDYKDVAEFVESIPYSETREYVQAILRNRELYRALYGGK